MFRSHVNPMGAFARGLVAGAAGAGGEAIFFRIMRGSTLHNSNSASASSSQAEERHHEEKKATTMVRQLLGRWLKGEPLLGEHPGRDGTIAHYVLGAAWGGVYGLLRESRSPLLRGSLGAAGFCTTASMLSENMILPVLHAAAPVGKDQRHAWVGSIVYGTVVPAIYEALRPQSWADASDTLWMRRMTNGLADHLPSELRPAIGPVLEAVATLRQALSSLKHELSS